MKSSPNSFLSLVETGAACGKFGLHVDDAEQTIVILAIRRHHPEEIDLTAWSGDIRMVSGGYEYDITFADDRRHFRIGFVRVNQLHAERGRGHIDVEIGFLGENGMLVRRPRGPVAWRTERDTGHQTPGLDVLADQNVELALAARPSGSEMQSGILLHVPEGDELNRVSLGDRRRHLCDVATTGACAHLDGGIARHIYRVVLAELISPAFGCDSSDSPEADQARFAISGLETKRGVAFIQDDAAVMQISCGGCAGRDGDGAPSSRRGITDDAAVCGNRLDVHRLEFYRCTRPEASPLTRRSTSATDR